MESKALFYGGECINKNAFHKKIEPIGIDKIEFKKIMLFDKTSYGNKGLFKYYIGYMHKSEAFPSYIKLLQLTGYSKYFNNNNYINFS